jgi:hypothetical protein
MARTPDRGIEHGRPHRADSDGEERPVFEGVLAGVEEQRDAQRQPRQRGHRAEHLDDRIEDAGERRGKSEAEPNRRPDEQREEISLRHQRERITRQPEDALVLFPPFGEGLEHVRLGDFPRCQRCRQRLGDRTKEDPEQDEESEADQRVAGGAEKSAE